jgi:TRAP-type C4-dicarboxylate transport system substrate-binding protein
MVKKLLMIAAMLGFAQGAYAATWDMSCHDVEDNYHTKNARLFAADVEKFSGGDLKIDIKSNSVLLKRTETKRGVQRGVVPIAELLISALGNEDPVFEVDAVPFIATNFEDAWKLWLASKQYFKTRLEKDGILMFYSASWPPQGIYMKNPVTDKTQFKGVRFRSYNASVSRVAELLGAIPATIESSEVPQAFSTGVVSGMLTSSTTGVNTQAWDYVKYYYDARAFVTKNVVLVNKAAYDKLTDRAKQALQQASDLAEKRGWEMAQESMKSDLATLASHGMQVLPPPPGLKKDLEEIGDIMTKEWLARAGDDGKALVEAYRKMK